MVNDCLNCFLKIDDRSVYKSYDVKLVISLASVLIANSFVYLLGYVEGRREG